MSMDIYARPGTKVRFTGKGGYDGDNKYAREHLEIGRIYTVVTTDVGSWSSVVELEEDKGRWFNTVMFENVYETDVNLSYAEKLTIINSLNVAAERFLEHVATLNKIGQKGLAQVFSQQAKDSKAIAQKFQDSLDREDQL